MKWDKVFAISMLVVVLLLSACADIKQDQPGNMDESAMDLDPRLKNADSLVVVFYKDPYGEDSLRYTRYYTQVSVTDAAGLDIVQEQLKKLFIKQEKRRNCRGEGKIWCFTRGKIFQTLYFSTSCDNNCCYFYLIKDGNFYYTRISQTMPAWLSTIKRLAIEPGNDAIKDNNN